MTFPLEIPCEQHRFILGKKGAGLKEIFDKTNVIVRIPNQEDNSPTIQVMGETAKIGEAITMIYKMVKSNFNIFPSLKKKTNLFFVVRLMH